MLFQFPPEPSGAAPATAALIRAWVFGRCYRAAQESGMTLQKTGEQVSLPVRWNAQADSSKPIDEQFGDDLRAGSGAGHVATDMTV